MFNIIRKIISKPFLMIPLLVSFLAFSCKESIIETNNHYSGEEMFEGIFFGQGKYVNQLPTMGTLVKLDDLMDVNDPRYSEALIFHDLIINTIQKSSPTFFDDFKNSIDSRNHLLISESLRFAAQKYVVALEQISGLSQSEIEKEINATISENNLLGSDGKISVDAVKKYIEGIEASNANSNGRDNCLIFVYLVAIGIIYAALALVQWAWVVVDVYNVEQEKAATNSLFIDQLVNDIVVAGE